MSVSASAAVVASAAAHLVLTAAAAFPSMYSAHSSSASCCRTFFRSILLLVLLEWVASIDPSQVEDVIEDRHWLSFRLRRSTPSPSRPGRPCCTWCCYSSYITDSFCLCPTKGAHTCVHNAQDTDILLPRLSLVHSQSGITSALNSSVRCFTEEELPFLFARGANQAI